MRRVTVITPAAGEPILLADAKNYLRVPHTADDALITLWIKTARRYCEQWLGRVLLTQTLEIGYEGWLGVTTAGYFNRTIREQGAWGNPLWLPGLAGDPMIVPRPPLQSVVSVLYQDQAGAWQTLAPSAYQVVKTEPATIAPAINAVWPFLNPQAVEPVKITIVAGYGTADDVPPTIVAALYLWLGFIYENRGEVTAEPPEAVVSLLSAEDFGRYG